MTAESSSQSRSVHELRSSASVRLIGAVVLGVFTNFLWDLLKEQSRIAGAGFLLIGGTSIALLLVGSLQFVSSSLGDYERPIGTIRLRILNTLAGAMLYGAVIGALAVWVSLLRLGQTQEYRMPLLDTLFWNHEIVAYSIYFVATLLITRWQSDWVALTGYASVSLVTAILVLEAMRGEPHHFVPTITGYSIMSFLTINACAIVWATNIPGRIWHLLVAER